MSLIRLSNTLAIRLVFLTNLLQLFSLRVISQTLNFVFKKYRGSKSNCGERHNGGSFTITKAGHFMEDLFYILVRPLVMKTETSSSLAILCSLAPS